MERTESQGFAALSFVDNGDTNDATYLFPVDKSLLLE